MNRLKHPLLITGLVIGLLGGVFAQDKIVQDIGQVSLIGEHEQTFRQLTESHPEILLSVCGNDMDVAYEKWMLMLGAMEDYAESIEYDIRGLKTYMYVFWNGNGTIAHLAFFPKTKSRNIPINELKAFFEGFVSSYQMQITVDKGFSHYGSAAFPTFSRPSYHVKRNE